MLTSNKFLKEFWIILFLSLMIRHQISMSNDLLKLENYDEYFFVL